MTAEYEINGSVITAVSAKSCVHIIEYVAQSVSDRQRVGLSPFGSLRHVRRVMQGQDPAAGIRIPMGFDQSLTQPFQLLAVHSVVVLKPPLQIQPFLLERFEVIHQSIALILVACFEGKRLEAVSLLVFKGFQLLGPCSLKNV